MRHLEVGAIIAIGSAIVFAFLAIAWAFFNWLLGPAPATVILAVIVLLAAGAIIIDWKTEPKPEPKE